MTLVSVDTTEPRQLHPSMVAMNLDDTPAEEAASCSFARQSAEFIVMLVLVILIFRTFAAEAYIVPTGSMAPTLLGNHREVHCTNCEYTFTLGIDESGKSGTAVCPNCGQTDLDGSRFVESTGDRVLVQKYLHDVRRPRRWEVSVFGYPGEPSQAYVKRVVGLPGETIRIDRGDIFIDGKIARKSLAEQRAMRVQVFDNNFVPRDITRYPRWSFRRGRLDQKHPPGWKADGSRFLHEAAEIRLSRLDWLDYQHWDPSRGRYAPIHDHNPYNGAEVRGENVVRDLMVEARVLPGDDLDSFAIRLDSGGDRFVVEIPVEGDGEDEIRVTRNGRRVFPANPLSTISFQRTDKGSLVEASVMDRRLTVAVDGQLLFDPLDYDDPSTGLGPGSNPIGFGARGGEVALSNIRVFRDIYYTGNLAFTPRRAFGVDHPYTLGDDEYFVLGDNSAVSNDSRFWPESPVVPGELFLGKPFLVHLPGQVVLLKVFGHSLYWVPDPRKIRYIR